jgi:hypothetical protein
MLLEKCAEVNAEDCSGRLPLHKTAKSGNKVGGQSCSREVHADIARHTVDPPSAHELTATAGRVSSGKKPTPVQSLHHHRAEPASIIYLQRSSRTWRLTQRSSIISSQAMATSSLGIMLAGNAFHVERAPYRYLQLEQHSFMRLHSL